MSLPEGASISAPEMKRIEDALAELQKPLNDPKKDHHAPREISVRVDLHAHHEYPKHVTVNGKVEVVGSEQAEKAALARGR